MTDVLGEIDLIVESERTEKGENPTDSQETLSTQGRSLKSPSTPRASQMPLTQVDEAVSGSGAGDWASAHDVASEEREAGVRHNKSEQKQKALPGNTRHLRSLKT